MLCSRRNELKNYFPLKYTTKTLIIMNNNLTQIPTSRQTAWKNITPAEVALWQMMQNKQLNNERFFRRCSIGKYFVDFYCPKHKLAIELGDEVHPYQKEYDEARTEFLNSFGITVIRFENSEVFNYSKRVLKRIEWHLKRCK